MLFAGSLKGGDDASVKGRHIKIDSDSDSEGPIFLLCFLFVFIILGVPCQDLLSFFFLKILSLNSTYYYLAGLFLYLAHNTLTCVELLTCMWAAINWLNYMLKKLSFT